ncbi:MAG: FAD-dependent oxidoreductase [Anaerolineae bacterium]
MIQHFRPEFDAHVRDKRCPAGVCHDLVRAPCQNECPAGMDVPGYVALLGAGRPDEALAVALDTNPFPSVCGRVCHHPCEAKCRRGQMDEPVAIRALKRHIGQAARVRPSTLSRDGSAPVAIVGAGPAGLSCAYFLARLGHHPVVFEQMPMAGGLLAWGIPDYRLPKDVVRQEIAAIEALGVTIHTGVSVGRDLSLSELGLRYQAVFLATGAQRSRRLGIEGENLAGVMPAVEWLRQVNLQPKSVEVGRRVVVVGGGNAAIDAARCALRLGAEQVTVLYRRSRAEMPALAEEVRAAEEEGVVVRPFVAPLRFSNDGGAPSLLCRTMAPGDFGADGRRQPVPIAGSEFTLAADLVLAAVGQQADLHCLGAEMAPLYSSGGSLSVDAHGRTALPWLFAGGDLASGPGTAIGAIAAGQRAALAIHRYLRPEDWSLPSWLVQRPVPVPFDPLAEPSTRRRAQPSELDPAQRRRSFAEVEGPLAAEVAVQEALRCLRCEYREGDGCHD